MQTKSKLRLEIKEISESGTFEGLLSPYGNVDNGADTVEPGAYTKTLKERGSKIPLLWQHKADCPVGELELEDRKDGLWCKGKLLMDLPLAQQAYLLIKTGIVKGLSIGFKAVKDSVESGVRHLKEIKLYEGSIVTFPMNESALITSVKAEGVEEKGDFNQELEMIQLRDAGYQMRYALSNALESLFWHGLTKEEMLSLAETIIQQFADTYMAFLPRYIDVLSEAYGPVEEWSAKRHETKAGAAISQSNRDKIQSACDAIKGGYESLLSLLEDKAGATTLSTKAEEHPSEPVRDHSEEKAMAAAILKQLSL